jgi:CDGSH-type Zn-finger protein
MSADTKITLKEDGPLLAMSPPSLRKHDGTEIETGAVAGLCRCGASKKKPFCDGSHEKIGFTSAPDHSQIRNTEILYEGEVDGCDVTVSYTPVLCSHAADCQSAAPSIFNPEETPWVKPEAGKMKDLLAALSRCPSGALRISSFADQKPQHMTDGDIEIVVEQHGPYRVKNITLDAEFNGVGASRTKYVLCRCGQSKNKPFCDGTHHDIGWRDDA